ncbi:MAG: ROK family protein [Psychrilyobacter sp.]|uniref:ROK family protein n=1 Tax=Psychrilyobacter sp. TaxID=2586924 RepID=UPI003C76E972
MIKRKMGNSDLIKRINISNIIEILKTQGLKSRADLAILTGLTPASITKLTKKLIDLDILIESGIGVISGGRPPILLDINPDAGYILGVTLSPNKIKGILTDINGTILFKEIIPLENRDKEHILNNLFTLISSLVGRVNKEKILGIGIALNGMVDYVNGISIFSPHYKWRNFDLKEIVEKKFSLPAIIDNDVRAMALGEHKSGVGIDEHNFIVINIGEGIGAGIILNNKLYRGEGYSAGEIGHITIEKNSIHPCSCGKFGCLEAIIGSKRILSYVNSEKGKSYINDPSIEKICDLALNGDIFSINILEEIAENLGYALSFLVNLLNPKVIIIVGEINNGGELFYKKLMNKVKKYSLKTSTSDLKIIPSKLGDNASTVGATILVYENLFKGRKILKV